MLIYQWVDGVDTLRLHFGFAQYRLLRVTKCNKLKLYREWDKTVHFSLKQKIQIQISNSKFQEKKNKIQVLKPKRMCLEFGAWNLRPGICPDNVLNYHVCSMQGEL